uniref:tRNA(Ile)-lysidine synthase, chloroplastic n=1 Tax=Rhexinema sarcinoideum TaxID=43261 RepID=A0A1B2RYR3_9CHLO|nr:hypothetical chloroplast RF62 [Rhexinema sarcinoideum]
MFEKLDCLKLINFIENSPFFTTGKIRHKKILIAFSGGQDSSCLLAIFYILKKKWKFELGVVYCNHCWNDSVKTAFKVFQILQKYNLPFYFVEAPNSTAIKPEQKARNWRYSSFYAILKQESYDFVLTGHSLSDCSETALFNLVRGSGIKGVCALKEYQIFQVPLTQKTEKSLTFAFAAKAKSRPKTFSILNFKSKFFSIHKKPCVQNNFFVVDKKVASRRAAVNVSTKLIYVLPIFESSLKFLLFSQNVFSTLNFCMELKVVEMNKIQKSKTKKNLKQFYRKKAFFKNYEKVKKKQEFSFKKTTFFIDFLYNFSILSNLTSNDRKTKIPENQFKKFCKFHFSKACVRKMLKFNFCSKNQTNAAIKQLQTVKKKKKIVETLFCAYLQRLKKFQKLDSSSSLISCFKPSKLKKKNFFFNFFLEKLITKKEKEKSIFFFFQKNNFVKNQNLSLQNQFEVQKFLNIKKTNLTKSQKYIQKYNFLSLYPLLCQQTKFKFQKENRQKIKHHEKRLFSDNLQKNEFLVFRPLIKINRETLFLFSKNLKLPICYDPSNKNLNLTRNLVRKLIIPLLKKINPSAEEKIYKFSRILEFYYELFGSVECPSDRLEIFRP